MSLYYIIIKIPNNDDFFIFGFSIVSVYSCKNKRIIKIKNSLTISAKSLSSYYTITNKPNTSNFFIYIFFIKNIYICKNKYVNTKINNNMQDRILLHIYTIKH